MKHLSPERCRQDLSMRCARLMGMLQQSRLVVMDPNAAHPLLNTAPICLRCGLQTEKRLVLPENPNGNGGRPMYSCASCNRFSCFGDIRGIHLGNHLCDCALLSRAQVAGDDKKVLRAVHYRCAVDGCGYFEYEKDENGRYLQLNNGQLSVSEVKVIGL